MTLPWFRLTWAGNILKTNSSPVDLFELWLRAEPCGHIGAMIHQHRQESPVNLKWWNKDQTSVNAKDLMNLNENQQWKLFCPSYFPLPAWYVLQTRTSKRPYLCLLRLGTGCNSSTTCLLAGVCWNKMISSPDSILVKFLMYGKEISFFGLVKSFFGLRLTHSTLHSSFVSHVFIHQHGFTKPTVDVGSSLSFKNWLEAPRTTLYFLNSPIWIPLLVSGLEGSSTNTLRVAQPKVNLLWAKSFIANRFLGDCNWTEPKFPLSFSHCCSIAIMILALKSATAKGHDEEGLMVSIPTTFGGAPIRYSRHCPSMKLSHDAMTFWGFPCSSSTSSSTPDSQIFTIFPCCLSCFLITHCPTRKPLAIKIIVLLTTTPASFISAILRFVKSLYDGTIWTL